MGNKDSVKFFLWIINLCGSWVFHCPSSQFIKVIMNMDNSHSFLWVCNHFVNHEMYIFHYVSYLLLLSRIRAVIYNLETRAKLWGDSNKFIDLEQFAEMHPVRLSV